MGKYCHLQARKILKYLGISLFFLISFIPLFLKPIYSATNDTINLEGKIVRNDTGYKGLNVTTGSPACVLSGNNNDTCDFQVKYYSASVAGTVFLTENFENVEIGQYNGAFNLSLGTGIILPGSYASLNAMIQKENNIFLEILFSPSGDGVYTETFSRMPLQSSAYSIRSKYSSGASGAFQFNTSSDASGYTTPSAGMVYFDTSSNTLKIYNGTSWENIASGSSGSNLWTDAGGYTYLTDLSDSFSIGSTSYTAIGSKTYSDYLLGLSSNSPFSFDMGGERMSISGDQSQSGLTVLSNYTGSNTWPLVTFKSNSVNFDSTVLNVVQGGTGKLASFSKADTEIFSFENDQTFYISKRNDAPVNAVDRLYNVNGSLFWNGSSVCTLATGCGSSSLWSDGGTYTYLTSTTDSVGIGGATPETSKFFFDVSNGRLGIGTSTPNSKFDIVGDGSAINLQEWRNSLGNVLSLINQYGHATFGRTTGGNAILSLGSNTATLPQMNFATSNGIDITNPNDGDLWWNGTNLYFFDGKEKIDLLGKKDRFVVYGLTPHNGFLNLEHNQNTYSMISDGFVCVGGSHDQNCTGGEWKGIDEFKIGITHTINSDWSGGVFSNVTANTGDIELTSGNSGIYTSAPISTVNAKSYGNISWNEELGGTGKIAVQTRSGDTATGPWGNWSHSDRKILNDSDIHGSFVDISIRTDGTVEDFILSEDQKTLYVGGNFTTINGESRRNLAAINMSTGLVKEFVVNSSDPYFNYNVNQLLFTKGQYLYYSGQGSLSSYNICRVDCLTGRVDDAFTFSTIMGDARNSSIVLSENTIYATSNFVHATLPSRYDIYKKDIITGQGESLNLNADDPITSLAVGNNVLYIGGEFNNIGGASRSRIAAMDINTGAITGFTASGGADFDVVTLTVGGNILYVGGGFYNIGGENRNHLAAININTGMVTDWNPNPDSTVRSMLLMNNLLYVHGWFTTIGGQSRNGLAAVDTTSGSVTNFNSILGGKPLLRHDGVLYVQDSSGNGNYTLDADTGVVLRAVPSSKISNGDITRQVVGFEDEDELDPTKMTKVDSHNQEHIVTSISEDLASFDYLSFWVYSSFAGDSLRFNLGNVQKNIRINQANQWEKVYVDISDIPSDYRKDVKKLKITNVSGGDLIFYIDNISAERIFSKSRGVKILSEPNEYFQYRVIFTNTDGISKPKLNDITLEYNSQYEIVYQDMNNIRLYNYSGQNQYLKLEAKKDETNFLSSVRDINGAVAFQFDTINPLLNPGAKLLSIKNGGNEKMYLDANGNLYISGDILNSTGDSRYISLAPTLPQIDLASNSNSIWINKTGIGGDLIKLQTDGSDVFVVNRVGDLTMSGNASVDGGTLTLGNKGNIRFNNGTNQIEFSKDGGLTWIKVGDAISKIVLSAEYAGAVLTADGSNNIGSMTSDNTGTTSNSMNYYDWNSGELTLNDYDIRVRITLPSNFDIWGSGGITIHYATESNNVANNKLDAYIFEQTQSLVDASSENNVSDSAGVWKTTTISGSDLDQCVGANKTCLLNLKVSSLGDNYVRVGDIVLEYSRTL